MDSLLAGTLILPWRVHCAGVMSSAAVPVEIIPGIAKAIPGSGENRSPSRRNHCSPSARNRVRLHPGTLFAFTPESCSSSPGIRTVPPERLLRAVLLQIFYTVRSERMLMEQMNYNLLFRWFVGLEMDEPVWNHAVFSKNRERLLNHEVAREFFARVLEQAKPHLSDEHFSVDGTLIEAWASQKSFQKKDGGGGEAGQFRGERRSNETHESKTDPDARLYRKGHGQEAKLGYLGHVLMENRQGLIVDAMLTHADGTAERDAALLMLYRKWRSRRRCGPRGPMSVGADKAYDTRDFVNTVRELSIR